jgi:hypothetical protein
MPSGRDGFPTLQEEKGRSLIPDVSQKPAQVLLLAPVDSG